MKNKLSLDQIYKPLKFNVQKNISMDLCDFVDNRYFDCDFDVYLPTKKMNLQRPLVWTLFQKQQLIISVLKRINIAPISIVVYRDDLYRKSDRQLLKIIDGKQRISTLISFCKNEFPLTINNEDYYYSDLDKDAKGEIDRFWFHSNRVYEYPDKLISDDDLIAWFEMINFSGTEQDVEHLKILKNN